MAKKRRKETLAELARASVTIVKMLRMRPGSILFGETRLKFSRALHKDRRRHEKKTAIIINKDKCFKNPLDCAKCMQACPEGVFFVYPCGREPGKICDSYVLSTAFVSRCTGCRTCIEACPTGALVSSRNI